MYFKLQINEVELCVEVKMLYLCRTNFKQQVMSSTVRKIRNREILDMSKYVNEDTGEMFVSENINNKQKVTVEKETGMVSISSNDYSVIDSEAIMYLSQILNNSDLGNVLKMSTILKTSLNIVFNNSVPHSNETLQQYLEISSEPGFIALIKRLIKAGVLYQVKGLIYGQVRVIYMMNPFLANKRKTFDQKVIEIFSDFKG